MGVRSWYVGKRDRMARACSAEALLNAGVGDELLDRQGRLAGVRSVARFTLHSPDDGPQDSTRLTIAWLESRGGTTVAVVQRDVYGGDPPQVVDIISDGMPAETARWEALYGRLSGGPILKAAIVGQGEVVMDVCRLRGEHLSGPDVASLPPEGWLVAAFGSDLKHLNRSSLIVFDDDQHPRTACALRQRGTAGTGVR